MSELPMNAATNQCRSIWSLSGPPRQESLCWMW